MMLDKKQMQAIFLFRFKMGQKAAATTRSIYSAFGRNGWRTYSAVGVQGDVHGRREPGGEGWWPAVRSGQQATEGHHPGWSSKTTQAVATEFSVDYSTVIRHLKKIEKVKPH